jgi:hypothetical protein
VEYDGGRHIGDILKERQNIILKGADALTAKGFTQVPNFILKSKTLSAGDKLAMAMILSYMWHNDSCFPGQARLAEDMGVDERSVRRHVKALQAAGLLTIVRRGLGKTNIYELNVADRTGRPKRRS